MTEYWRNLEKVATVDGFLGDEEAVLLCETAAKVTDGCIVEIGSYRGKSTIMLALGAKEHGREVYAIDPHADFYDGTGEGWQYGTHDRAPFLQNILNAGVADTVRPVFLPSLVAAVGWSDPIGFLWVDAAHDYDNAKADIDAWVDKVLPDGYIAFHDNWFPGVSKAINELLAREGYAIVTTCQATTVIRKSVVTLNVARPDVSVLVPAYNAAATILDSLESVLAQDGVTIEVCVCDDCSTDDTAALVVGLQDSRVRLIQHDHNQGLAYALNSVASIATGRYFIELDSDDRLADGCLSQLVKALDAAPPDVGFAYGQTQYHGDATMLHTPATYRQGELYYGFSPLYAFLYRREAWDAGCRYRQLIEREGRWIGVQDYDFALQLTEHMRYEGLALPDVLVLDYNYHAGTLTELLHNYNRDSVTAFRERWPRVQVQQL
jgi:predicted O-methyltransferase YrrM